MRKIHPVLLFVPIFFLTIKITTPLIRYYWSPDLSQLMRFVLLIPVSFVFIHALHICSLIYVPLLIRKWPVLAVVKRKRISDIFFFGKTITINRVFYVCQVANKQKIASVLGIGTRFEKKDYLLGYGSYANVNKKVVFDPIAHLWIVTKLIFWSIVVLSGRLLSGLPA